MKQYIAIAALIAAGAAFASADDEQTMSPFLDRNGWYHTKKSGWSDPNISALNSYVWKDTDTEGTSTYSALGTQTKAPAFERIVLDSPDDYLTFTYDHKTGSSTNSAATFALAGSEGAIVIGHSYNQPIGYATSMTSDALNYTFTGTNWGDPNGVLEATPAKQGFIKSRTYSIEGNISWDSALSTFVLNLAISDASTTFTSGTIALGDEFSIERLIIAVDASSKTGQVTFSNLELTWGHYNIAVPEPSAFGLLAGLGALALAGTRRRRR